MGTVHKFKRPPKNQQQFKGYRLPLSGDAGRRNQPRNSGYWRKLPPWQQTLISWVALVALAAGIVALRALWISVK